MTRRTFCKLSGGAALALTLPLVPAPANSFLGHPDTGVYLSDEGLALVVDGLNSCRDSMNHSARATQQFAEMLELFRVPRHLMECKHPIRSNYEQRQSLRSSYAAGLRSASR